MRLMIGFVVVIGTIELLQANPIALDPGALLMVSEKVEVTVHEGYSNVFGNFVFRRSVGSRSRNAGEPLTIEVPFFAPWPQAAKATESSAAASITIGKQIFRPSGISAESPPDGVPPGWSMVMLEFAIPSAPGEFLTKIRYRQPHFPNDVSGYYPINPPSHGPKSWIHFVAARGIDVSLMNATGRWAGKPTTRLSIPLENKRLILVRAQRSGTAN